LVICKPGTQEAYWQVVSGQTVMRTDHGWKMIIPAANRFRANASIETDAITARLSPRVRAAHRGR
jgi:hypothetical protein